MIQIDAALKTCWQKIKDLCRLWFTDEWELTVYYTGQSTITSEGHVVTTKSPEIYNVRKMKKLTPKHIVFIDMDKHLVEIKVTEPVGYTLRKVW